MTRLIELRPAVLSLLAVSAIALAACVSVPQAPIDSAESARRLAARSLSDPGVLQALARAELPAPEQGGWNLDALTVAAWTLRPDIAFAVADVAAGGATERVAGQLPNPSLSVGPGYVTHNANNNVSPWMLAATVGFTIESGGKRRIRSAQARAATQTLRWQLAESLWRARQEVRKALLSRELAQRGVTLAEQEAMLRESFNAWVDTEIRFGAAALADRLAAQTSVAQVQGQLRTAQGDLAAADADLAASLGIVGENLPLAQLVPVAIDRLPDPASTPQTTWRQWSVTNRLSVSHALADYEVTEQQVRMAVARQYPDLSFGPGYSYDKGDGVISLAVGLTLPLFHGEQAEIDEALAVRQKAAAQFEVVQAQALAEVNVALARYRAAYAALAQARDAESATGSAMAAVKRRLTMGAADRGELLTAQLAAVVSRRATLDALRAAVSALDAMEASVQRPVWPASNLTLERFTPRSGE